MKIRDQLAMKKRASKTLLNNRFLCVGTGLAFNGSQSGDAEVIASIHQDIMWALGRPAFDIRPARPLRILTITGEYDDDDLNEMVKDLVGNLGLSADERSKLCENTRCVRHCESTGQEFLDKCVSP